MNLFGVTLRQMNPVSSNATLEFRGDFKVSFDDNNMSNNKLRTIEVLIVWESAPLSL